MRRLLVLAALLAACSDDTNNDEFQTGSIEITTATTGQPNTDFTVLVDGGSPRTVSPNGDLLISAVSIGSHVIQLTLPTGCVSDGENPRTINVTEQAITTVAFTVTCG